jgi:hypothetical protein
MKNNINLNISESEIETLKENIKIAYCNKKSWDINNLKPEQLLEILNSSEYKNPAMIKS